MSYVQASHPWRICLKGARLALHLYVFTMGAVSLVVQSVLVREVLAMAHGSELVLGFLFSSWFLWIALGAWLGARLAMRARRPRTHLALWAGAGSVLPILEVELFRHAERWAGLPQGVALSWQATWMLGVAVLGPFCLVVGVTFPLAVRVFTSPASASTDGPSAPDAKTSTSPAHAGSRSSSSRHSPVARLYLVEASGAVLGGLVFAFVLIGRMRHLAILGGCATLVMFVVAFLETGRARRAGLVASLASAAALPWLSKWDDSSRLEQVGARMPGHEIVAVFDTPYEQIALGKMSDQFTVFANGSPVATVPDAYETPALVYALVAQQPSPTRVLVVGNPGTGLADELVSALGAPVAVTFVHADAQLIRGLQEGLRAARRARVFEEGARRVEPTIVIADPRAFLRTCRERFDLVFVDAPEPTSAQVNRLYTAEFYASVARVLQPSGVLAVKAAGGGVYSGSDVSAMVVSIRRALETAFEHVVATAGDVRFLFAGASMSTLTRDPAVVAERLQRYPASAPYARSIRLGYEPARVRRLEKLEAQSDDAITNSDHHPSSYYYGSVVWERVSSQGAPRESWLTRALSAVRRVRKAEVLGAIGVLLVAWGLWVRRATRQTSGTIAYGFAMFVAGFAAMADEMALLLEYQSACGALYQRLAVMSALFLLGTATAGACVDYALSHSDADRPADASAISSPGRWATFAALAASAAFAALTSRLIDAMGRWSSGTEEILYGVLFFLAGAMLGATVPAVAKALTASGGNSMDALAPAARGASRDLRAAGLLSAMDHLGAMVGSLTIGTLVLPALGTRATLEAVVIASSVAACIALMSSGERNLRETCRQ